MKLGFDILFFIIVGGGAVGGFFLGDERSQRLMIGSLIGVFAASQLAVPIAKLAGNTGFMTVTNMSFIILIASMVIFVLPKKLRDSKWPKNKPRGVISGLLAGLFVVSYSITFLSLDDRTALVTDHNLAAMAYDLRFFVLGALLAWLTVTLFMVGKAKR